MSIRPEIPDIQGVQDPTATKILKAVKSAFDSITGRAQPRIKTLGASANFFGTVKKVNEIINRLQGDTGAEVGSVTTIPDQTSTTGIAGSGTVTSVAQSFTGGLISVSGSPITTSGTLALTVAGTSGGIVYFSGATTWASSALLTDNGVVIGGGAGAAPETIAVGTNNQFLRGNTGAAPAFGSAVLASADFVNQGTTTTVLHGNAAGNPSWGAVSLTADVSGLLPLGNMAGIQYYAAVHG